MIGVTVPDPSDLPDDGPSAGLPRFLTCPPEMSSPAFRLVPTTPGLLLLLFLALKWSKLCVEQSKLWVQKN